MYAWNLAGPYEHRFSYRISVGSFVSSVLLIVSTAATWRLIKNKARSARSSVNTMGIVLGVIPACYYLWYANPRDPVDFTVVLLAIVTILAQVVLWKNLGYFSMTEG
jgi:CDP-diglyceride synthetase